MTLKDLCTPRQTTFSRNRAETVAEINDLAKLDAKQFFDETHVTDGMATLLRQVFQRLTGQSDQGVYRLKQAMGGGKTHNLLAAALLTRDAGLRKSILGGLGMNVDGRAIRLSAFSGRETDMRDYLWVRIFRDLGCEFAVDSDDRRTGAVDMGEGHWRRACAHPLRRASSLLCQLGQPSRRATQL